jgi:hypothetical protein
MTKDTYQMRQRILDAFMESEDVDLLKDALSEVVHELTNDRYTTSNERIVGIYESLEMVFNIDLIN